MWPHAIWRGNNWKKRRPQTVHIHNLVTDRALSLGQTKQSRTKTMYKNVTSLTWSTLAHHNNAMPSCPYHRTNFLLDIWFFFFFLCVPSYISGFHHSWWDFCTIMWLFFNPTIEIVTFHLRGWWLLGACFLPAFTHLWHECQDRLSPYNGMHMCTDYTSVYTLIWKGFREWSPNTCKLQGKVPLYQRLRARFNTQNSITQDSEPNTLPAELFWPLTFDSTIPVVGLASARCGTIVETLNTENTLKHLWPCPKSRSMWLLVFRPWCRWTCLFQW